MQSKNRLSILYISPIASVPSSKYPLYLSPKPAREVKIMDHQIDNHATRARFIDIPVIAFFLRWVRDSLESQYGQLSDFPLAYQILRQAILGKKTQDHADEESNSRLLTGVNHGLTVFLSKGNRFFTKHVLSRMSRLKHHRFVHSSWG